MPLYAAPCRAPFGLLDVAVDEYARLVRIDMLREGEAPRADSERGPHSTARCQHVVQQLEEYFAGTRTAFELELNPRGTAFQQAAWNALRTIPFAHTITYGEQARRLGRPTASRAIGAANGRNPIPIVVPCHRVIGASGALVGFAGGLDIKRWLLAHEAAHACAGASA